MRSRRMRSRERGVALVFGMIGMLAILAVVGLALDGSHMLISKTRLQNMADAAALSAAKTFDQTKSAAEATDAASASINANASRKGNREIQQAIDDGVLTWTTEFSATLSPFTPEAEGAFIRVTVSNLQLPAVLVSLVGTDTMTVSAASVSGPSPSLVNEFCDLAPFLICGEPDGDGADDGVLWGYDVDEVIGLKLAGGTDPGEVGPGNYRLLDLGVEEDDDKGGKGGGGNEIRYMLAGKYQSSCYSLGDDVLTKPGVTTGPVQQGLNTRLGQHDGPLKGTESLYPQDKYITEPDNRFDRIDVTESVDADGNPVFTTQLIYEDGAVYDPDTTNVGTKDAPVAGYHSGYQDYYAGDTSADYGEPGRRIMAAPVGHCDGTKNGASEPNVKLLGVACVYIVQSMCNGNGCSSVFGQIIDSCSSDGSFGSVPVAGPYPTKIILYKDVRPGARS